MARISEIKVKPRGGFRGKFAKIRKLIDRRVRLNIEDFREAASRLRDCDKRCDMQLDINGRKIVTWHSSEVLTQYLKDCRAVEDDEGVAYFPIESVRITEQDDGSYMLVDASDIPWLTDEEIDELCERRR